MPFNWVQFCRNYSIAYVVDGHNVARGNINIHCPFCGQADQSEHMGLDTRSRAWGCWRNTMHRGRNPTRLIAKLLSMDYAQAALLVADEDLPTLDAYEDVVRRIRSGPNKSVENGRASCGSISMPKEFHSLSPTRIYARPFVNYLEDRGLFFHEGLVDRYDLRYCLTGSFARRLIVPVRRNGHLISWVGRSLMPDAVPRYLTLAVGDAATRQGQPAALTDLSDTVLNYDLACAGGDVLFVCEGPFDAIKVDWLGYRRGAKAVATFGMPKPAQIKVIVDVVREGRFRRVVTLLDSDTMIQRLHLQGDLEDVVGCPVSLGALPRGVKDPGELNSRQFDAILNRSGT